MLLNTTIYDEHKLEYTIFNFKSEKIIKKFPKNIINATGNVFWVSKFIIIA
jgi:hypothetical protein